MKWMTPLGRADVNGGLSGRREAVVRFMLTSNTGFFQLSLDYKHLKQKGKIKSLKCYLVGYIMHPVL